MPRRRAAALIVAVVASLAAFGIPGASPSVALAGSFSALNWIKQDPATSPPSRFAAPMAYDAATGNVVMFGGDFSARPDRDTWIWH